MGDRTPARSGQDARHLGRHGMGEMQHISLR